MIPIIIKNKLPIAEKRKIALRSNFCLSLKGASTNLHASAPKINESKDYGYDCYDCMKRHGFEFKPDRYVY